MKVKYDFSELRPSTKKRALHSLQTSEHAVNDRLQVITGLIRLRPPKQSVVKYDLCWLQGCLGRSVEGVAIVVCFCGLQVWVVGAFVVLGAMVRLRLSESGFRMWHQLNWFANNTVPLLLRSRDGN